VRESAIVSPHISPPPLDGEKPKSRLRTAEFGDSKISYPNRMQASQLARQEKLSDLRPRARLPGIPQSRPRIAAETVHKPTPELTGQDKSTTRRFQSLPSTQSNGRSASSSDGCRDSGTTTPRQLLRMAVSASAARLPVDVYNPLDEVAKAALNFSDFLGTTGSGVSTIGGLNMALETKVDNFCRSITELCLALTEGARIVGPTAPVPSVPVSELQAPPQPNIVNRTFGGASGTAKQRVINDRRDSRMASRQQDLAQDFGDRDSGYSATKTSNIQMTRSDGHHRQLGGGGDRTRRDNEKEPLSTRSYNPTRRHTMSTDENYTITRIKCRSRTIDPETSNAQCRVSTALSPCDANSHHSYRRKHLTASGVNRAGCSD
jgi:hypothetical protein